MTRKQLITYEINNRTKQRNVTMIFRESTNLHVSNVGEMAQSASENTDLKRTSTASDLFTGCGMCNLLAPIPIGVGID
ncbi:hypothetical protein KIN20_028070 [Parelaphostrongylus tenuis]|uniref:Uncharacterized protein n=1 Tax=Parelaphostrongylus tenuis TaxID=148309 RepID=A0AAD5WEG6_PARTN|nr:hypothetical protein KIN20_028070 [Parelaphostrongylus tenuis]